MPLFSKGKINQSTNCAFLVLFLSLAIFVINVPTLSAASTRLASLEIKLEKVLDGVTRPVDIQSAKDGSGRLFIVSQTGEIWIYDGKKLKSAPFLDISTWVKCCYEQGLLGLAFHPDFPSNGFFFVNYIDLHGNTVIARYKAASGLDVADASSATMILTFDQPFGNHNGGQLAFGPDGFLYISTGDGGGGGDASNNAQNLGSPLGKILRIDVDKGSSYTIPPTNPFVNRENVEEEIWVYGLRNPWRFSFDRKTNAMFIGDVGQGNMEEIDLLPGNSRGGENFGWRLMEGSECFNPSSSCNDGALKLPILEYHNAGANCSVVGGYRYRGKEFPFMDGIYFFGDFCSGRIWGAGNEQGSWEMRQLLDTSLSISTFGEDEKGEIYIAHLNSSQNDNGSIYRLKRVTPFPQ